MDSYSYGLHAPGETDLFSEPIMGSINYVSTDKTKGRPTQVLNRYY